MRPPSASCAWCRSTSWLAVAGYSLTGTFTSPNATAPVQIALICTVSRWRARLSCGGVGTEVPDGCNDGRRRRGASLAPEQPRQGPVPERGDHEGRRDRVLRGGRDRNGAPRAATTTDSH